MEYSVLNQGQVQKIFCLFLKKDIDPAEPYLRNFQQTTEVNFLVLIDIMIVLPILKV